LKHVLVTGATGALGRGAMARLLQVMPEARFTVLTRRPGHAAPHPRVAERSCDLTADDWTANLPRGFAQTVTAVLHMAADVRWNLSAEESMRTNTKVCARLADWAQASCGRLERFCYVSTAFVDSPTHLKGAPNLIEHEGRFYNNAYEYSKRMGEREILARRLPSAIVRPSLIVGDSRTGEIGSFNGLYTLLRLASQGQVPLVAGRGDCHADIVPLDTSVEAVRQALAGPLGTAGQVIWAISGSTAPTVRELLETSFDGLNTFRRARGMPATQAPAIVPYETYRRLHKPWFEQQATAMQKRMMDYIDVFAPYFSVAGVFRPEAPDLVVQSPDWRQSLPRVIAYWCKTNETAALKSLRTWKLSERAAAAS
jgi:nucleoside-diphosphate-sugar epimerase